uniref:Ciliogenesis and planar polarity effector 1 n=1 Tax=Catharus ustulatus TaxID=91951 RepID=A0A8C3V6X9_CATUS
MEIKLDVLISTCIKQRKPWPRISWIGQEKEAVFLLDGKHINEINLASGKKKKKIPLLQSLLKNVVVLTTSGNAAWLAGILTTGELFLWNRDQDCLKIVPAVEESKKVVACLMRLYLYVSGDGRRVLLTTPTACAFLWESTEHENTPSGKNCPSGRWTQILPDGSVILPSTEEKEIGVDAAFIQNEVLGDCCLCSFVFYSDKCLVLTFLVLRWHENTFKNVSSLPYQIQWVQQTCSLVNLVPRCVSVKSRGALLCTFARDGLLLAVAVNQTDPKATQVLFLNTLNFVTVSGSLKGCSSKNGMTPSRFIRSYWVGDMSWTPDSLFLACMLKRGCLILLTCMGELLTLIASGCSVEFGPDFKKQHHSCYRDSDQSLGSSDSERDLMRQRFSVASHPRLPYLIVSDGYMITLLSFPNNFSPSGFIRSLLLDSTQKLENIRQNLLNFRCKGKSRYLRSLLSLKTSLLKQVQNQSSIFSTIPRFLEEDTTEMNEKTMDLLDHEEESDNEKQFYNNPSSFYNQRIYSSVGKADEGFLEFASMFDTIHAEDDFEEKDKSSLELYSVQKNLLGAWQIGISKNMEEKDALLNYTVNCIIHFFSIVRVVKCALLNQDASLNKSVKNTQWMHCVLKYFQQCLTVLYWHSRASVTGHVTKLTLETLKLMLMQQQDELFSKNLLACFCLLKMVSHTLSRVCVLQYENFFSSPDSNTLVELDSLTVPVFLVLDDDTGKNTQQNQILKKNVQQTQPSQVYERQTLHDQPGLVLTVLWRLLYNKVVWYQLQLKRKMNKNAEEASVVSLLLSHIQATIQSSGMTLEQHLKINSVSGEEQFLLGSYRESLDIWKRSLSELKTKGGKRAYFLQRRYYLAILFCHLYQYNMCEAQGLCDHLVREVLRRSQLSTTQMEEFSGMFTLPKSHELWMVTSIHTDTATAVIRSMARFMAAYFTKQLLYILPPHNVDILHPLHIKQDLPPRVIPLQHCLVTRAVRNQNLSSVWTAEYALDLFFIGGLIPEAVWLAHTLGDWKLSVSIGLAYRLYCQNSDDNFLIYFRTKKTECHLPLNLLPMQIFQEKLQSLFGQPATSETSGHIKYKKFTDPIEEEDADVLYSSMQELLKAAVMADVDILSETFQLLMDSAKDLCRKFYGLVPVGLCLPAPPLYCPQPASVSEEDNDDILLKMEKEIRQKVSGVLQRIILLFRAAHCSCSAAQWYITQLKWARKVMQKIRMKASLPLLSPFPETLLHYCNFHTVLYGSASSGAPQFEDITCWFREFCALCWMFHVREKLSDSCRRYQTARENINNIKDLNKNGYDAYTVEHCLNAVEWACRMLPFCRFMNAEELVQDVILSLLGELPPIEKVAEIFVKAFPNPEDIRVSLRDKYNGLQQRLRHSTLKGPESEEMMSVVIQSAEEVRKKTLRRVVKNIGPIEINIWEPVEEGASNDEEHCYEGLSLGTSLSTSTLNDFGNLQVYSDVDMADRLSDALHTEEMRAQTPSFPRYEKLQQKIQAPNYKTKHRVCRRVTLNQCNLPVVGAWEFERDDDEYVRFLELFLSYVLEKDLLKNSDLGIPFLTSFSGLLQEHELNSLFFDVHTTLKRRQNRTRSQSVFRAGSCYTVTLASCDPEKVSVCNENKNILEKPTIVRFVEWATEPSVHNLTKGLKEGLFGLKHKSIYRAQTDNLTIALTSQAFPNHNSSTLQTQAISKYVYKTLDVVDIVPAEELPIELMGKLSNISKLMEWMIRWSDKRLLCGSNKHDSFEEALPVLHVKTSAAAILTSFWLLEQLHGDRSQIKSIKCKVRKRMRQVSVKLSAKSKYYCKKEINNGNNSVPHITEDLNKVGPFVQHELDVTSEQGFSADISVSDSQPSQTAVSTVSSLASHTSVCAKQQEVKEKIPTEEKPNTSETVRQMLQDEMFKLVQVRQINFISSMQIVQSSFTNVPDVQQTLQQHQSVHLAGSQSSVFQPRKRVEDESNNGKIKNHLDMSASLTLFENNSKETGLMSPSQDLHSSVPTKPLHLLAPSSGIREKIRLIPVEKKPICSNGFPLLKLESSYHVKPSFLHPTEMSSAFAKPPPVPRVAWSSSNSLWNCQSSYIPKKSKTEEDFHRNRYNIENSRQMHEEEQRWAETVHKGPPKHLNSDLYEGQQEDLPQPQFPANVNVFKAPTIQNLAGIPLLHLQLDSVPRAPPAVRQPVTTTLIPVKPATKDADFRETPRDAGISLLQINVPQKKKVPDFFHSQKGKKRRSKKQLKEKEEKKKPSVSFRPDDSIISISDTAVTESETGHNREYISVTDIEDRDILSNLPMIPESAEQIAAAQQDEKLEIPSTAKFHHTAASVTNAVPPGGLQKQDDHQKNASSKLQKKEKSDSATDIVTWNILHKDGGNLPSSRLPCKVIEKEYFSTKQKEMDMQLQTLQNIVENMEQDFRNSKIVSTNCWFLKFIFSTKDKTYVLEQCKISHLVHYLCFQLCQNFKRFSIFLLYHVAAIVCGNLQDVLDYFLFTSALRVLDSASGHSQRTEKERKEIQTWMKRKQKERMREYLKKLDEQRQKEHHPFNLRKNTVRVTGVLKSNSLLSEHHRIRISQALSLMNEMLSETVPSPTSDHMTLSSTRSPHAYRRRNVASSTGSRIASKPGFGQKVQRFTPSLGLTQSRGKKIEMKSARSVTVLWLAFFSSAAECRVSRRSTQKPPQVTTAVQTEDVDLDTDRDVVSPWTVPDDIQRILQDTHDSISSSLSPTGPCSAWHDVSESTGSILSKLDWNAVEAMIADVEDK